MKTTTAAQHLTSEQLAAVFVRIDSTGPKGADKTQIERFIADVIGASGSRSGYDAPYTTAHINLYVMQVQASAAARGYRSWQIGQGPWASTRIAK